MIKIKLTAIIVTLLLFSSISIALESKLSHPSISFSKEEKKIISLETETIPLLISYQLSSNLKNEITIMPEKSLRITKTNPLVLELSTRNLNQNIEGFLMINTLYEKLPEETTDSTDDTIIIPIEIGSQEESTTKMYISLTEPTEEQNDVVSLGTDLILPTVLLIIGLLIVKRKWQNPSKNKRRK